MKRNRLLLIGISGATGVAMLAYCFWPEYASQPPVSEESVLPPSRYPRPQRQPETGTSSDIVPWWQQTECRSDLSKRRAKETEIWAKARSAGLVFNQATGPESPYPVGTVRMGQLEFGLGETPPYYKHQLATACHPIMIGQNHDRHTFRIHVTSLVKKDNGFYTLGIFTIEYPNPPEDSAGLETSGGLVFVKDENPVSKIGVLIPRVIQEMGESEEDGWWQIQLRVNERMFDYTPREKAKPQYLKDLVVLMATNPEKIPAVSPVIWFKFEKAGTVSLLDE